MRTCSPREGLAGVPMNRYKLADAIGNAVLVLAVVGFTACGLYLTYWQ